MAKLKAEAIGRDHSFLVCNSPVEADEIGGHTFDSSQQTLTIVLDKKVWQPVLKKDPFYVGA
jgi:hypothetical protein